ncbi:phage tail tube protein [Stackebrandtia soli]|uniref:phage tail tube protein n=1 Tax=Stackebrandtia soli TaxID=1892856 RepID=UPI0039E87487
MAIAITGVTPDTAPTTGGTYHYVTGTDLDTVTGVLIGGTASPAWEALSPTLIKALAPAGTAGAANVVLNPGSVTATGAITFEAASATEQLVAGLARDWALDVDSGTPETPTWLKVRGMGELKPTIESNMEDDSDYDSDGWASEVKTQLKWALETKLLRKRGISSGANDPGQEVIRAASDQFGAPGTVHVRWYNKLGGPEAYTGFAAVSWEPEGGSTTDLESVTVNLSGNGRRTLIVNPAA